MRVPQVTERMKEAPAHALRAVFAGIGQVLLVADRIRNRPADGADATSATAPAPAPTAPTASDLPVPGYDELSVASLRARMRSLDVAQLRALVDYESAHAARPAVLAMFERRIAKVEGGEA